MTGDRQDQSRREMLTDLISAYFEAQRAWHATPSEQDDMVTPEWEAYEQSERAVLLYPCQSIEDVRAKAAFLLGDQNALDTVQNSYLGGFEKGDSAIKAFLRSLLGETSMPEACGSSRSPDPTAIAAEAGACALHQSDAKHEPVGDLEGEKC